MAGFRFTLFGRQYRWGAHAFLKKVKPSRQPRNPNEPEQNNQMNSHSYLWETIITASAPVWCGLLNKLFRLDSAPGPAPEPIPGPAPGPSTVQVDINVIPPAAPVQINEQLEKESMGNSPFSCMQCGRMVFRIVIPCRHLSVCPSCARIIRTCPERKSIYKALMVSDKS